MYGCDVPQNDPHGSPSGLAGHGCCTRAVMIGVRAVRAVRLGLFHTLPLLGRKSTQTRALCLYVCVGRGNTDGTATQTKYDAPSSSTHGRENERERARARNSTQSHARRGVTQPRRRLSLKEVSA